MSIVFFRITQSIYDMNKSDKIYAVGLGEILWDLFPEGKQLGGAPANFAYFAQILGAKSFVVSTVGDDDLGREIINQIESIGLTTDFVATDPAHATGTVSVALNSAGVPDFTIHQNVAWDYIPLTDGMLSLASRADVVCFGSLAQRSQISKEAIQAFLKVTRQECVRVYDVNLRQSYHDKETVQNSLEAATIVKLNEDELSVIADYCSLNGSEIEALTQLITRFDLKLVALTKGDKGSYLLTSDIHSELSAPSVQVVDTVGAGDAFTSALVIGYLSGQPIDLIHRNATILAAYVCTQKGATPSLPSSLMKKIVYLG